MNFSALSAEVAEEDDYLLDIKDICIGPLIGQGQFATVYLGKYFGDYVAVKKQVREAKLLETYLIREISLLQKTKHENLISFFGAYNEVNEDGCQHALYIVTEFCQGGDLLELLVSNPQKLGWKFRIKIALQAASAINYLHENNFIHRDIKSSNLLIDQDFQCKICDFGMAVEVNPEKKRK
jgi:serine/threonine protein kinase